MRLKSRHWVLLCVLLLTVVSATLLLKGLGSWLMVSDSLRPARAIAILNGHAPFRAMEAALLYRQGWAAEVWVTRNARLEEDRIYERLGIPIYGDEWYSIEVLKKLGVPQQSVRLLPGGARNTVGEDGIISGELKRVGGDWVILVTDKQSTRRARATWYAVVGKTPGVVVRPANEEPYDAAHWWRNTVDAETTVHEVVGLLNIWAGFPVRAERR